MRVPGFRSFSSQQPASASILVLMNSDLLFDSPLVNEWIHCGMFRRRPVAEFAVASQDCMKTRLSLLALPALVAAFVIAMPELHAQTPTAVGAAQQLIEATAPAQRAELLQPFTEAARSDWHYTPRRRDGVAWKAMSTAQREATTALLRTALNERGLDKVRARDGAGDHAARTGGVRLFARPGELRARDLRRAGHRRLGLAHRGPPPLAALQPRGRALRVDAASVLRCEPGRACRATSAAARRARASGCSAARRTWPVSGSRASLAQRERAIFDTRPYGDIVSRNAARAKPLDAVGLPFAEMDAAQQAQVLKLIGAFADHLQPELSEARLARVRAAPLDSIRVGWAGSDSRVSRTTSASRARTS